MLLIPILAFVLIQGVQQSKSIVAIEANRYTAADQAKHLAEVSGQMMAIWQEMAKLRVAMAELPPVQFRAYVESIDARQRLLEIELAKLTSKLNGGK